MDLATAGAPAGWSDDDVWEVFLGVVERETPIPGLARSLQDYRSVFADVVRQVRAEHACLDNRYFRTEEKRGIVNPANIEHLTRLIHYLNQRLVERDAPELMLDCLFYVLKGRCQINLFYRQRLSEFFFALHALGAVLGYGEYGRFLIVNQGATVGHNRGRYPTLGEGVVIGPHAAVLGGCSIGNNVWIGAGALVIDTDVPDNSIVIGRKPHLQIKPNLGDNRAVWFDMDMIKAA
jgi:serine O-acetyltransferase